VHQLKTAGAQRLWQPQTAARRMHTCGVMAEPLYCIAFFPLPFFNVLSALNCRSRRQPRFHSVLTARQLFLVSPLSACVRSAMAVPRDRVQRAAEWQDRPPSQLLRAATLRPLSRTHLAPSPALPGVARVVAVRGLSERPARLRGHYRSAQRSPRQRASADESVCDCSRVTTEVDQACWQPLCGRASSTVGCRRGAHARMSAAGVVLIFVRGAPCVDVASP
jgi:hypothetical protein